MFSFFLVRTFIKDYDKTNLSGVRTQYGYLSGIVGILANLVLFGVKLTTGLLIHSIAFIGDAFNNLTDAASSLVTMIGFKLANRPADEEHPFGHGRLEYIAGLIVSFLIILVGYELLKSSLDRILHPLQVAFNLPAFLIVVCAILVKGWLFLFNRFMSQRIDSTALLATAYDSLSDMISTGCIGLSLIAALFTDFALDGYVGLLVAGIIIYSGFTLTKETISPLLGEMPDQELIEEIRRKICSYEQVSGVHDLIVHSYGPGKYMASIHVEIPSDIDIILMHEYIDMIEVQVAKELGILLTIHMDPLNLDSEVFKQMTKELETILKEFPDVLSFHDLRIVGKGEKQNLVFDVVVKNGITHEAEKNLRQAINESVRQRHQHFNCVITFDKNDMLLNRQNKA